MKINKDLVIDLDRDIPKMSWQGEKITSLTFMDAMPNTNTEMETTWMIYDIENDMLPIPAIEFTYGNGGKTIISNVNNIGLIKLLSGGNPDIPHSFFPPDTEFTPFGFDDEAGIINELAQSENRHWYPKVCFADQIERQKWFKEKFPEKWKNIEHLEKAYTEQLARYLLPEESEEKSAKIVEYIPPETRGMQWSINTVIGIIQALRNEVKPIDGHSDPKAIQDCFEEAHDLLLSIKAHAPIMTDFKGDKIWPGEKFKLRHESAIRPIIGAVSLDGLMITWNDTYPATLVKNFWDICRAHEIVKIQPKNL